MTLTAVKEFRGSLQVLVVYQALERLFCFPTSADEPATMQPCYQSSEAHHGKQFYLRQELARLKQDLVGDGWLVLRHDVAQTATVLSIKSLIQADYLADPTQGPRYTAMIYCKHLH